MSILSVAIVVVTVISHIFISAVRLISEHLACAKIYISRAFGKMFAFNVDGIVKKLDQHQWRTLHTSYIKPYSASTPVPESDIACLGTDNLHRKNHSLFDPGLSELGSLWHGQTSQDAVSTSGHLANGPAFGRLYREALLINRQVLLFVMVVLLMIPAVTSMFTWYSRRHCLQVANIEILGFINSPSVRARKVFLLKRMSSAVSILNGQIDSVMKQIAVEHERVSAELPTFLDAEVKELRDALETQFQNEFDHHVLEVKNFADNLERARSFPDPEAIEAECKDFQSELQRWRQQMGNFLAHASIKAEKNGNIQIPVKHIMATPEEVPTAQVTETEDEAIEDKVDRNDSASLTVSESPRAQDEKPISRMALWTTASGYPAPTPAEIEEGRRIRRERVAKRMTENNGQRSVRSESGPRKRRCAFRYRRHGVHKQDHDAARQSNNPSLH
ncbi:uncharacterized protein P174DRAFT_381488 [Aspergillus novofumigatus IBT 16806]|uniref:Uncharacterized protein n=1 Tax=Aspergillus novofumigatus (strain IBT 16806) TaxID=1392255 RepID=A0A2I1CKM9_ASPN1|nr:uncharacterized protein P174DRAFT_381488 [Aspergillus novofumigatus IBT 16806]PKX98182.1 hypothetical protein P174DRAFT_381488 [Aspergillus novofumigatus IBT 16806]